MKVGRTFMNRIPKYALTLLVLVVFVILLISQKQPPNEQVILNSASFEKERKEEKTVHEKEDKVKVLFIDVKGEVKNPGVYTMKQGSRVKDAIEKAGGFTSNASPLSVNLAKKLVDEMVVFVAEEGSEPNMISTQSDNNKIYINQATIEQLKTLPGIGYTKAKAILQYREKNGPFSKLEDLLQVKGIGTKTLESFKDEIHVP